MKVVTEFKKGWQENGMLLNEQDKRAKDAGTIVGRYVQEQIADGYALYVIIRENKSTVRIRLTDASDYSVPYWGKEATIDKAYALDNLLIRDDWSTYFSKQREGE